MFAHELAAKLLAGPNIRIVLKMATGIGDVYASPLDDNIEVRNIKRNDDEPTQPAVVLSMADDGVEIL